MRDSSLLHSYVPASPGYDEAFLDANQPRPHWATLLAGLGALGRRELDRRWEKARQLLHENGVSYNVYGDPQGMERPWSLSPIPVRRRRRRVGARSTRAFASARACSTRCWPTCTARSARLLEGLLPPELVFENPGFLRPCHGENVPRGRWLPLYGADLVRAARTAASRCSTTARRRPRARATRSRTAS